VQYSRVVLPQTKHGCLRYAILHSLNVHVYGFHFPRYLGRFLCTCTLFVLLRGQIGKLGTCPRASNLLMSIFNASCFRISSIGPQFLPCTGPSLPRIHLCDQAKERELAIWPPFFCPNLLQPNWVVPTIIDVVDPMFCPVVPAKRLGVFKQKPTYRRPASMWRDLESCRAPRAKTSSWTRSRDPLCSGQKALPINLLH
jgi:hypothetical protein